PASDRGMRGLHPSPGHCPEHGEPDQRNAHGRNCKAAANSKPQNGKRDRGRRMAFASSMIMVMWQQGRHELGGFSMVSRLQYNLGRIKLPPRPQLRVGLIDERESRTR